MASFTHPTLGLLGLTPIPSKAPYRESLAWLTDLLPAYDGGEERVRVRNKPRQRLHDEFTAQPERSKDVFNTLYGGMARRWAIPVWSEARAAGNVAELQTVIPVDTAFADFRVGSPVLLLGLCGDWQVHMVEAMDAESLTLATGATAAILGAYAIPVRVGRIVTSASKQTNGYGADWSITYECDDNIEFTPAAPTQYHGDDIYLMPGLSDGGTISEAVLGKVEEFDYDTGLVNAFTPWLNNRTSRPYRVTTETPEEAWNLRLWLHRRAGRYRPFWQPTFENDVRLAQTGAVGASVVVHTDNRIPWAGNRTNLAFGLRDGTWVPRRVTSDNIASTTTRTLGLETPLNVNAAEIVAISYLGLKRLDSDVIELNWVGNGLCDMSVQVLELSP